MNRTLLLLGLLIAGAAQGITTTEVYRINSGHYVVVGGFAGVLTNALPNTQQHFLELTIDHEIGRARLRILGDDGRTEFRSMSNGVLDGGVVRFSGQIPYPGGLVNVPAQLEYSVQLGNASIWMNGSITARPGCCDIPSAFLHEEVHATIIDQQPVEPSGLYCYVAYGEFGIQEIASGLMSLRARGDRVTGWWNVGGVGNPVNPWRRGTVNRLSGLLNLNELNINLHPGQFDDNIHLYGTVEPDRYSGRWEYTTFVGPVESGTFVATRKEFRVELRNDVGGMRLVCRVGDGVEYVVERSRRAVGPWEVMAGTLRYSSGGAHEIELEGDDGAGWFYRLRAMGLGE